MRNAFSTDPVRMKLSQFKYESGLIPDDEILAFVLFLVADSDLVEYASATGEVEFDDLADLPRMLREFWAASQSAPES